MSQTQRLPPTQLRRRSIAFAPAFTNARILVITLTIILAIALVMAPLRIAHTQIANAGDWPNTDFSKRLVDLNEILSGGPPKDGIPSIDQPQFVTAEAASEWLDPREPVITVSIANAVRAYPIQILMWHEIVNDTLGDVPVSVTFCPLCNATIIFDRRIDGRILDFGTTGRLRKSDLVMYDRQSESWWQQFSGRAIVGELVGKKLTRIPGSIVAFEDFHKAHPRGDVLSRETGHSRDYGQNPYAGYDNIDQHPFLFSDPVDPRLPAMERVLNVSIANSHHVYPFAQLKFNPVINDTVADQAIAVFAKRGTLSALDARQIKDSRTLPSATAWYRKLNGQVLEFRVNDGRIVDTQTAPNGQFSARQRRAHSPGRRWSRRRPECISPSPGWHSIRIRRSGAVSSPSTSAQRY